jgi:HSP20 family protein
LWRTRPYVTPFGQLIDQMFERAFAPLYSNAGDGGSTGYQSLPVNIWETKDAYHAAIMAPGIDEQSINVTVQEDTLTIEGDLKLQLPEGAKTIWQEFGPTRFRRTMRLGAAVDSGQVQATYTNGVLFLTMPRAEHAKPREVQVQVAGAPGAKELKSA